MSELMTQEEINAMLNGTTTDTGNDDSGEPAAAEESVQESVAENFAEESVVFEEAPQEFAAEFMTEEAIPQEYVEEYTEESAVSAAKPDLAAPLHHHANPEELPECLDPMEADALGEIGNICMGAAATALYSILGRKVSITTPTVECTTHEHLSEEYDIPFVVVDVQYTEGVIGNNLLILRVDDVKKITDIMMGGEGVISEEDLSELHLSAISEAMNQMMGGMSTSMADMLNRIVNISPPRTMVVELSKTEIKELINSNSDVLVKIGFKMEIEGIVDSGIMQLMPMSFAKELVDTVMSSFSDETPAQTQPAPAAEQAATPEPAVRAAEQNAAQPAAKPEAQASAQQQEVPTPPQQSSAQSAQTPYQGMPGAGPQMAQPQQHGVGYPQYPGWPPYQQYPGQPGYEQQNGNGQHSYPQYPPYPHYGYPPYGGPQQQGWPQPPQQQRNMQTAGSDEAHVDVRPVQLNSFDLMTNMQSANNDDGMDMIMDVPLQITVELGQSKKSIKDILDITVGSVITLDKVAGEPVDIVVNGKMIARGEVIVIDDSYGVRITEIVSPSSRLRNIK